MGVKLVSSGGGSVEINPPATASSFIATMPAGTGNVVVNGVNGALVAATAQASTSGTSIDFTGIPSWVRRITVMFNGVSTNGSFSPIVQIGSGSFTTSGYTSDSAALQNASSVAAFNYTTGFGILSTVATNTVSGSMTLTNVSGNVWVAAGTFRSASTVCVVTGGQVSLAGTLDRVRITTLNGTDTFDAGTINIMYE